MFHLMEPLFDLSYLGLVIALGLRLLLEENPSAKRCRSGRWKASASLLCSFF